MEINAEYLISFLGLEKHLEGGYYKEIYKTEDKITDSELSSNFEGKRHLATSIYFLLKSGEVSKFHRLISDEIWYFHAGDSLTIHVIDKKGHLNNYKLGLNLEKGEQPQIIIPKGDIFGATIENENKFCLVGCMVSPGFDFSDFELLSKDELMRTFPEHEDIITLLT
jgi:uncharacterized protein